MPAIEIITGPIEVWAAPLGEAFPDLADAPTGNWVLVGKSGSLNQTEDGLTVRHEQTINSDEFRSAGSTGPRKLARTAEDQFVEFTLMDLTATTYARALVGDPAARVVDTPAGAGTAGTLSQALQRGLPVLTEALLVRKDPGSPELAAGGMQYQIPEAGQVGSLETVYVKGAPAGLAFSYQTVEDIAGGFGDLVIEDEEAT